MLWADKMLKLTVFIVFVLSVAYQILSFPLAEGKETGKAIEVVGLKSGDLVFRKGRGIFSDLFQEIGGHSKFSHVGIVYMDEGNIYVIHTEASEFTSVGFARMEKLGEFISKRNARNYQFFRVVGVGRERMEKVLQNALSYVRDGVPFDTGFDLQDDSRLYCTELVYKAYLAAGFSLIDKPLVLHFPDFVSARSIEVITIGQLVASKETKPLHVTYGGES